MAIDRIEQSRLWTAALAKAGQIGGRVTAAELFRFLQAEYASARGANGAAARGLAVRAMRAMDFARTFTGTSNERPRRADIPVDSGILPGDPRYRYTVALRFTLHNGTTRSAVVDVETDNILTRDEAVAQATATFATSDTPRGSRRALIQQLGNNTTPTGATVISVGQRQ